MSVATQSAPSVGAHFERAIVGQIAADKVRVMPLPTTATELMALVASGDFSLRDVVEVVSRDQALAAYVLRNASSAGRAAREVCSIDEAVTLVGARDTMSLAVALGIGAQVCGAGPLQSLKLEVWRRATFCAAFCRQLARRYQLRADEAFLVGLMANFGKAVALSCIEAALPSGGLEAMPRSFWMDVADKYNQELGLVMVSKWQLPGFVGDVVSELSSWNAELPGAGLARLVAIGDAVGALADSSPSVNDELLAEIPGLEDETDRDHVLGALATISAQMWSMGAAETPSDEVQSAVAVEATPLAQAVDESVVCNGENPSTADERPVDEGPTTGAAREGAVPEVKLRAVHAVRVVDIPTTLHRTDGAAAEYRCTAVSRDGLVIVGQQPLPAEWVVLLTLHGDPELTLFGTVARCVRNGDKHHIGVKPMTLQGEEQEQWDRLVRGGDDVGTATSQAPPAVFDQSPPANDQVSRELAAPSIPRGASAAGKPAQSRKSVVTGAQPLVDVTKPFPAAKDPRPMAELESLVDPEPDDEPAQSSLRLVAAAALLLTVVGGALTYFLLA